MQSAETVLGVLREITGEPGARKRARRVRREAARKRTCTRSHLAVRSTPPTAIRPGMTG